MSADLQMVRGENPGEFNLSIGEARFIQQRLDHTGIFANTDITYPHLGGEPGLLEELQRRHPGKHIVVTVGGKQAISAAIYALTRGRAYDYAYHKQPYWVSMPTLVRASEGLQSSPEHRFYNNGEGSILFGLSIVASPNNPDSRENEVYGDIVDLVYAHPVFGWTGFIPQNQIAIYSASKAWGLSGLRVGWLVTENKELADSAAYYVEITTSGVPVNSQNAVEIVLRRDRNGFYDDAFKEARIDLITNGELFLDLIGNFCLDICGVPHTMKGMFSYFLAKDPEKFEAALKHAKVRMVTGEACGAKTPGWWRCSMGHLNTYTEQALSKLKDVYLAL